MSPRYRPYDSHLDIDPYPTYAAVRNECPVYHDEEMDFWALFSYDDVQSASRDWETFSSASGAFLEGELEAMREFMPPEGKFQDMDPPRCLELRRIARDPFLSKAVARTEDSIRAVVTELLDQFDGRTDVDLATEFSEPLPVRVISDMLGLPATRHAEVSQWCHTMFERDDGVPTPAAWDAGNALRDFLSDVTADRRERPTDDVMSHITHATIDGVGLTDREIIGMAVFLYAAGNETTSMLIGNMLLLLAQRPDERSRLRADPTLIPAAIEECLRFDAPVCQQARMTTRDVEIGGTVIPSGKKVLLMYASANRDEAVYTDPDQFDISRQQRRHMSFGEGIHFCLGAPLARLETRVAVEEFLRRYPDYEVGDDIQWSGASVLHGPVRLPATLQQ